MLPIVCGLAAFFGGAVMPARNRDENTSGNTGMSAAVPFMNREIRGQALATWLKKRLSFGRRKREPLSVRAGAVVPDRP